MLEVGIKACEGHQNSLSQRPQDPSLEIDMLTSMLYFYIQYIYIYYTTWEISSANMDF